MDVLEELGDLFLIVAIHGNVDLLERCIEPICKNVLIDIKYRNQIVVPTRLGKIHTGNRAVRSSKRDLMAYNGFITYYNDEFVTIIRRKSFYIAYHKLSGMVSNDDPDNVIITVSTRCDYYNYDSIDTIYGIIEDSSHHIMDRITRHNLDSLYDKYTKPPLIEYKVIYNNVTESPVYKKAIKPIKISYYSTNDIKQVFREFNYIITFTFCGLQIQK